MTQELLFKVFILSALAVLLYDVYQRKRGASSSLDASEASSSDEASEDREHVLVPPTKLSKEEIDQMIDDALEELNTIDTMTEDEIQGIEREFQNIFGSEGEGEDEEASISSDDLQQVKQTLQKLTISREMPSEEEFEAFDEAVDKFAGTPLQSMFRLAALEAIPELEFLDNLA